MNVPRIIRRLFRAPYDGLRHYGVVKEGVLYRSGQPTPEDLDDMISRLKLKTVVSLRGTRDDGDRDAWEQGEREVCEAHGTEFVPLPCNHKNPPTREQVRQFLDICDDAQRQPVLVHCRLGQQRTLLFCALYRVHADGISPNQAELEMDALGFGIRKRRHQKLLDAFRKFTQPVTQ